MDVDGALEVGHLRVVVPPVVREPSITVGHQNEVAGAWMIESGLGPLLALKDLGHAGGRREQRGDLVPTGESTPTEADVGHLVIRHREGVGRAGVDHLAALFLPPVEKSGVSKDSVRRHRVRDRDDAVLAHQDRLDAATREVLEQPGDFVIEFAEMLRDLGMIGSEFLESVVEVGEVDQRDRRVRLAFDLDRGIGDPAGAGDVGERAPEPEEREGTERPGESIPKIGGLGETVPASTVNDTPRTGRTGVLARRSIVTARSSTCKSM